MIVGILFLFRLDPRSVGVGKGIWSSSHCKVACLKSFDFANFMTIVAPHKKEILFLTAWGSAESCTVEIVGI